ncbi:MAG TPA: flagellin, partial [Deltaproteobacteria bacterium]|nr:flagellin [Deltaproteobacteria bacterium]
ASTAANTLDLTFSDSAGVTIATQTVELKASGGTVGAQTLNFDKLGISINVDSQFADGDLDANTFTVTAGVCGGIFQVGSSNSVSADTIGVSFGDMQAATLGIDGIDLSTRSGASDALTTIDSAIDTVNNVLGDMGAAVNRLEYTYTNLQVSIENFSASQSVIRDVDMAAEMISFTKNQILLQAGTAMLAQANMSSQNVLSLLG